MFLEDMNRPLPDPADILPTDPVKLAQVRAANRRRDPVERFIFSLMPAFGPWGCMILSERHRITRMIQETRANPAYRALTIWDYYDERPRI